MYYLLYDKSEKAYVVVSPTRGYSQPGWVRDINIIQNSFTNFTSSMSVPVSFNAILLQLQSELGKDIILITQHNSFKHLMKLCPELLI